MFLRFMLLVGLLAVAIFCVVMLFMGALQRRRENRVIRQAIQASDAKQREVWTSTKHVQDLINLHARMVFKHGPDSEEAKTFRFGVENQRLVDDRPALIAFNQIADLIEENAKRIQNQSRV